MEEIRVKREERIKKIKQRREKRANGRQLDALHIYGVPLKNLFKASRSPEGDPSRAAGPIDCIFAGPRGAAWCRQGSAPLGSLHFKGGS